MSIPNILGRSDILIIWNLVMCITFGHRKTHYKNYYKIKHIIIHTLYLLIGTYFMKFRA